VSTALFADVSNKAIMFAGIVYALALLAHIVEWALGRNVPLEVRESVAVGGSASAVAPDEPVPLAGDLAGGLEDRQLRVETFGRIGVGWACS
jgi:hypothetical protein